MEVVHFHRRPQPTQFSLEGYFERIRGCFRGGRPEDPSGVCSETHIRVCVMPCLSSGVVGRLRNILFAWRHQGAINHITGDVHYIALLLRRRRTLLTIHDCQILERLTGWRRKVVRWLWYTLPARRVAAITVVSAETKRRLLREIRFPGDRIHVVPVSVSSKFQPSPKVFDAACPRILQVGTKANKNVVRLVQALRGVSCHLDIVGPIDAALGEALAETGVPYTSFGRLSEDEMVDRYRQADIIAFVSTSEGFGMPILEAQSVERVCVTSNCSSMPEIAGEGACLVDPVSVTSIRDGILRVASEPSYRETLIERGRVNRRRFDERALAMQYAEIYRALSCGAQR